jgi:hypothetical protein
MSKFLKVTLWIFSGFIGTSIFSAVILTPDTPVLEDPGLAQLKACLQKHERIQHATTDDHKTELWWWCMRQHYDINR